MILVDNKEALIGDFLGTVPAMQALARQESILVYTKTEAHKLLSLVDLEDDNIKFSSYRAGEVTKVLECQDAFRIANQNDWYMTQAFMKQVGLEVPSVPPKAKLKYTIFNDVPRYDYLISPFARSLPPEQKWAQSKWQELVDSMPDKTFGLLGTIKHDEITYVQGDNVSIEFDHPFSYVCNLLKAAKCLVSVVTGTSHLAFHLSVPNIVLTNQNMRWGNNPDGILIKEDIPTLSVQTLKKYLELIK